MKSARGKYARYAHPALFGAAGIGVVSLCLSYFAPEILLGIEADKVGFSLFWIAVLLGFTGLSLLPASDATTAVTLGEKRAVISLVVTLFAGVYLFVAIQSLGWNADPRDRRLLRVVTQIATLLIASGILMDILRRRETGANIEDERDTAIHQRAAIVGYQMLAVLLVVYAVTVGYSLATWYPLTPLAISHAIIGMFMLSEASRYVAEVWFYRRDRT